ncbi:MAG: Rho termination factor N-terminal domain-containing protein [Ilumatobacter sp.]
MNTIERKISDVNDSVTVRLDDLENSLPSIPSKALAASRASARRMNDVVATAANSIKNRFDNVADDTSTSALTTSGQARSAAPRAATAVRTGVAETTGQARAQAKKSVDSVSDEVEGALDDAKVAADPDDFADMTKSELYDRATKLDIDGRSGMTKAELVGALQKA